MGSGQGRSRRVNATAASDMGPTIFVDPQKWTSFCYEQGMDNVRLADYYEIKLVLDPVNLVAAGPQQAQLAKELFQDFVLKGALVLPDGVNAEDFDFDVRMTRQRPGDAFEVPMLLIKNNKTGDEENCIRHPHYNINGEVKLNNYKLAQVARNISGTIQKLLADK